MWRAPKPDVVIAMTSPPLIGVLGALLARARGAQFVLWMMDMNPDEAVAAGWLRSGSLPERVLRWLLHFSLQSSARVIVLDRFMRDLVAAKGVPEEQIAVVPPWPFSQDVAYTAVGREAFRRQHGLCGKFVVMFAGNHSPCHPLDTLLAAAQNLSGRKDIAFCFVGGGADYERVRRFASERTLDNIICLGYRTRYELSGPLSAADLQVIAMGDPFVGIVHPCKVYNIATLGIPALYIGPEMSPIPEVLSQVGNGYQFFHARHGEVQRVESLILKAAAGCKRLPPDPEFMRRFAQEPLIGRFRSVLSELEEPGPDMMCDPVRAHQS
jgi:glycosyltransferase involved in cell wall biosynthesis